MWLHHLFSFFGTVVHVFFDGIGTTVLGRTIDIAFAASLAAAVLLKTNREHGWRAMLNHWRQEYKAGIRFTLWCAFIIYTPVIIWAIGKSIYEDHQYFIGHTKSLESIINQNAGASGKTQRNLEGQIADWRANCSKFEGANGALSAQNRDQQNTINRCQQDAIKLLAPEPFKLVALTLESADLGVGMKHVKWLVLVNKITTPTNLVVSCKRRFMDASASIVGSGILAGGTSKLTDHQYEVNITTPAWGPESPLIFDMSYIGDSNNPCTFVNR